MEDLECPYCKHDQEACEIYETEVTHEVECDGCGKNFRRTSRILSKLFRSNNAVCQ